MTNLSGEVRQLMADAKALGYGAPEKTRKGHLLWVHPKTKRRVVTGPRTAGRALRNARAELRRCAREETPHVGH